MLFSTISDSIRLVRNNFIFDIKTICIFLHFRFWFLFENKTRYVNNSKNNSNRNKNNDNNKIMINNNDNNKSQTVKNSKEFVWAKKNGNIQAVF